MKTPFEWAPHSPDVSPPDLFLWGHLKDEVYKAKPQTIEELKQKIREEIAVISTEICKAVIWPPSSAEWKFARLGIVITRNI